MVEMSGERTRRKDGKNVTRPLRAQGRKTPVLFAPITLPSFFLAAIAGATALSALTCLPSVLIFAALAGPAISPRIRVVRFHQFPPLCLPTQIDRPGS